MTQEITVEDISLTLFGDGTVELGRLGEHVATLDPAEFEALIVAVYRVGAMPECEDCDTRVNVRRCRLTLRSGTIKHYWLCDADLRTRSDGGQNIVAVAP